MQCYDFILLQSIHQMPWIIEIVHWFSFAHTPLWLISSTKNRDDDRTNAVPDSEWWRASERVSECKTYLLKWYKHNSWECHWVRWSKNAISVMPIFHWGHKSQPHSFSFFFLLLWLRLVIAAPSASKSWQRIYLFPVSLYYGTMCRILNNTCVMFAYHVSRSMFGNRIQIASNNNTSAFGCRIESSSIAKTNWFRSICQPFRIKCFEYHAVFKGLNGEISAERKRVCMCVWSMR